MKPHVIPLIAGLVLLAGVAAASSDRNYVEGVVNEVQPIYTTHIQQTPIREKICHTEDVPVFSRHSNYGDDHEELEGLIAGGLVGSAIGNAVSDKPGAGTAGAVVGALIGRQQAEDRQRHKPGVITGYRQQNVCRYQVTRVDERTVEKLTGYELDVLVDGETISITTDASTHFETGDSIRLSHHTDYRADDDDDYRDHDLDYDDDDHDDYDRRRGRSNGGLVGLTVDLSLGVVNVAANIAGPVIHMVDLLLFGW